MAQTIRTLCDVCLADGQEVDGVPFSFGVAPPGGKWAWALVDMCEEHGHTHAVELGAFMDKYGRGPSVAPKAPKAMTAAKAHAAPMSRAGSLTGPVNCPACDHESANESALRAHVSGSHDRSLDQLRGVPTPFECPHCERAFTRPQSLTLHVTRTHADAGAGA